MRFGPALLSLLLALGATGASPTAAVASPASKPRKATAREEDEARTAVKRGLVLAARGSPAEALVQYERAKELVPDANLPYRYAAQVLVELGRIDEAITNLEKYLEIDPRVADAEAVGARIAELRSRLSGKASVVSTPDGASVFVDGSAEELGKTPLSSIVLSAGEHVLSIRRAGFENAERKVTVRGGQTAEVALELIKVAPPSVTPAPVLAAVGPSDARAAPPARSLRPAVGLTLAGVGVASLVVAVISDRAVASKRDDFDAARASGGDALSIKDDADRLRTLTLATGITGGVLLAAGLTVALWPSSSKSSVALRPGGASWQTSF